MFSLQDNLKFININQDYLKYLHDSCSEVYYKPTNYDSKPYLGILISTEQQEYVIPLSSAKDKHKSWKNVEADRFVIYEICQKSSVTSKDIYIDNKDGSVKHILSVMDLKKMIPIKEGLYSVVELNPNPTDTNEIKKYKVLMNLEFTFCLKIINQIIQKVTKLYDKQMETGKIIPFCCDFKLLEEKCKEWIDKNPEK